MSIVAASFLGFLILLLTNVNGSLIRLFCQYPNSELCKMHHRLYNANRYNSRYINVEEEPLFVSSFDDETDNLNNQFEGNERITNRGNFIYFFVTEF